MFLPSAVWLFHGSLWIIPIYMGAFALVLVVAACLIILVGETLKTLSYKRK